MQRLKMPMQSESKLMKIAAALFVSCVVACASPTQPFLNDDKVNAIQHGMTSDEVIARIGEPYQRVPFTNLNAIAWDYRYTDTWGYLCEFSVMMGADRKVINKVNRRLTPIDKH
jgi:outer membrane protein assembly factor BamE (lipoprotein component of BamABCDE complex)